MMSGHLLSVLSVLTCWLLLAGLGHDIQAQSTQRDQDPNVAESNQQRQSKPRPRVELKSSSSTLKLGVSQPQKLVAGSVKAKRGKNGGTVFEDQRGRRKIEFVETDKNGIKVYVTIKYRPNDLNELTTKHPELSDYIELFPKQVGDVDIAMELALTSTYTASDADDLEAKHPRIFSLYRRYFKKTKSRAVRGNNRRR